MAVYKNYFNVDLGGKNFPQALDSMVCQANVGANQVGAYVYENGEAVALGGTCTGKVIRSDGSTVALSGNGCVVSGNLLYVTLTSQCYEIPGMIEVIVNSVRYSATTTIVKAFGTVERTTTDAVVPSANIPNLDQLLAQISAMQEATSDAEAIISMVADLYSASSAYAVGDYCIHDGGFYRCTTAIASPGESWTSGHWTATNVGDEIVSRINTEAIARASDDLNNLLQLAPPFDQNTPFAVGDYCIYQDELWVFTSTHAAGIWIGTDAQQVRLGSQVSALKSAIGELPSGETVVGLIEEEATARESADSTLQSAFDVITEDNYRELNALFDEFNITPVLGDYNGTTFVSSNNRAVFYSKTKNIKTITPKSGYQINVSIKPTPIPGNFSTISGGWTSNAVDVTTHQTEYLMVLFRNSTNAVLTNDDILNGIVIETITSFESTVAQNTQNIEALDQEVPKNINVVISSWDDNKYVDSDGTLATYNNSSASGFIDVSDYNTVTVTTTMLAGTYICLYDSEQNVIGNIRSYASSWAVETYTINTLDVHYIRITCKTSYKDQANVLATVWNQINQLTKTVKNIISNENNITLGSTYTTLYDALTFAGTIATEYNVVNIFIPAGEYNAFAGIDLTEQTADFKGLIVPDYVNIIGIGSPENVIIKAELPADMTGYAFTRGNVSTLNMWRNNDLKNVKVISKNMRYPVHNDKATTEENDNYVQHFENCYFLANGESGVTADNVAFGSGMAKGAELYFKNCVFESTMNPFMCTNFHNRLSGNSPVTWNFEHCQFIGGQHSMLLTSYNSGQTDNLNFVGCKMDAKIIFQTQLSSRQCDYKLWGCGNSILGYVWNGVEQDPDAIAMML